jgi:hypothetical protein
MEAQQLPTNDNFKHTKMYCLLGRQSKLTTSNTLLAYEVVLNPIWTYGLRLRGTASTSNIEILERFQSKALRTIADAPWYETNALLQRDLHIQSVKEEIQWLSSQCSAKLNSHPNLVTANLKKQPTNRHCNALCQQICPPDSLYKFRCKPYISLVFKFRCKPTPQITTGTWPNPNYRRVLMTALLQDTHQLPSTNLLNVLVQIVNKLGLKKNYDDRCRWRNFKGNNF